MRALSLALSLLAVVSFAADGGTASGKKQKFDLGLSKNSFAPVPKAEGLETVKEKKQQQSPTAVAADVTFSVVRVLNGKSFTRTPDGAKPSATFAEVATSGDPPTTEKFSTVARIKCPQKLSTDITLAILDMRDDTLMDASGTIVFKGGKDTEAEWTVDWDPTPLQRGPGEYKVLVRVAGQSLGTFPLKIAPPPEKK
jgi:hypothetical protein